MLLYVCVLPVTALVYFAFIILCPFWSKTYSDISTFLSFLAL